MELDINFYYQLYLYMCMFILCERLQFGNDYIIGWNLCSWKLVFWFNDFH